MGGCCVSLTLGVYLKFPISKEEGRGGVGETGRGEGEEEGGKGGGGKEMGRERR